MQKSLVSIIIPAYNARAYICEAVDSAIAQTYPQKEVIVVDDGSTDDTVQSLKSYIDAQKIIYFYQENKGLSAARNAGIRAAKGEFIAFLDADDIFLPEKLARQVAYLEAHPACGVCYCALAHFSEEAPEKMLKLQYHYYSGDEVFPRLLHANFINPLAVVARKSELDRVGLFDETYRRSEDWEYWVRLARQGVRFEYLSDVLANYRIRKTSMSYDWKSEIQRKATTLRFMTALCAAMTPDERRKYGMQAVLRMHRGKLWYAYAGTYFPPLRWLHQWRQKNRLA